MADNKGAKYPQSRITAFSIPSNFFLYWIKPFTIGTLFRKPLSKSRQLYSFSILLCIIFKVKCITQIRICTKSREQERLNHDLFDFRRYNYSIPFLRTFGSVNPYVPMMCFSIVLLHDKYAIRQNALRKYETFEK